MFTDFPILDRHGNTIAVACIDEEDYDLVAQYKWFILDGYAYTKLDKSIIGMHQKIVKAQEGVIVDHKNGNRLDNRRSNLRRATLSQNNANQRRKNKSGYTGVRWHKKAGCWEAYIHVDRRFKSVGYRKDVIEAALLRDRHAYQMWGEFAALNFPELILP